MKRFFSVVLVFLATSVVSALAEIYPSRPITIVVPFPPGGSSDVVTRLVAQKLADNLQANVVIDNRGGGGGVPAAIAIKQTPPDGYTLFLANNGLFAIMPALSADLRFDPISSRLRRSSRSLACWWCRRLHRRAAPRN
jgi:tripartite-type tricarboxylate transporter receptor subunit TctC